MLEGASGFRPLDPSALSWTRPEPESPAAPGPVDKRLAAASEALLPGLPTARQMSSLTASPEVQKASSPWKAMLAAQMARFPYQCLQTDPDAGGPGTADAVFDVLRRMVIQTPSEALIDRLATEVRALGEHTLQALYRFGVTIVILARDMSLTEFTVRDMHVVIPDAHSADGREFAEVRGFYKQNLKLILVGEEELGRPHASTALHEFGHAWDHAYSHEMRLSTAVSVQLWNRFATSRIGCVDPYAQTNPAEYFAVCFEAYYRNHPRLAGLDPDMACFLEALPKF